jgi:hypothetical protein
MNVQNIGRAGAALLLSTILAGCGAAGAINAQQSGVNDSVGAATQSAVTVVITRTVVVTSTVFATVSVGTSSQSGTTARETASALTSTAVTSSHPVHVTPTPVPGGLPIGDAATVTLAFLGALEKDQSGASSLKYLSTRLQAIIQSGHSIASLIGVPGMYTRYHADAAISRGGGRAATVVTTLTYSSGPVQRLFTLIPEAGTWHIDDIADTSA